MSRKKKTIQTTADYKQFVRSDDNRPTDTRRHKKLIESMRKYGFLECFPIVCVRDEQGQLVVKDGQHRLEVAMMLGLPVAWVEEDAEFDIAAVNCAAKGWTLRDYATKWAASGHKDYQTGLDFAAEHAVPLGMAFSLLAGTTTFSNFQETFCAGEFRVKDRKWADAVAALYSPIVKLSRDVANQRFLEACMAMCRVPGFDAKRLVSACEKQREKLINYASRDAYLQMCEDLYNFGRTVSRLVPLKLESLKAMRERSAAPTNRLKAPQPVGAAA